MKTSVDIPDCPCCSGHMVVEALRCDGCGVEVRGRFEQGGLVRLSREHEAFVGLFLETRGNLKEAARRMGISYPTMHQYLDRVLDALGVAGEGSPRPAPRRHPNRLQILARVERGEITVADALEAMGGKEA